ncbi:hypothetical protein I3843_04G099800 [Carya illinoinensis]|nr:hypothetical protein I3760_04G107500 [Carya illinoinensis]KAG6717558.1 hypothetical protein I3842_04G106900 [Carya illinoinensis]KAG7983312.1 hypothetical protein I3843_04G099800 [Carya illinoinensis]
MMSPLHSFKLFMVLTLCMGQSLVTPSLIPKYHVHIINGFQNETLGAHCKSKDDDLGIQQIPVHGDFEWHFHVNFIGSTLFFCRLWWSGGDKVFDAFVAADKRFINNDCGPSDCWWKALEDGIYLYSIKHEEYRRKYLWEPKKI